LPTAVISQRDVRTQARENQDIMGRMGNIRGQTVARNSFLNLMGFIIPSIFVIIATPYIVNGFGNERYGLLSLTWMLLSYFILFDLGFGPAVTKFVSESIAKNQTDDVSELVWTTVFVQGLLGVGAGLIMILLIPFFTEKVFLIPETLKEEARGAFYIAALYVPVTFISGSFNGFFAAIQRFDIINLIKIPAQASIYIAGIVGVHFHYEISGVLSIVLAVRVMLLLTQVKVAIKVSPVLSELKISKRIFRRMAAYGGWITLSNSINPVMFYVDRFLIGAMIGMSALTFYTVPFDLAARLWVISTSMTLTLFPAFSALTAEGSRDKIYDYFVKSIKALTLISGPIVCLVVAFSPDILNIWVGSEFANKSTLVFQVLLVSTLIDYPGIISCAFLEGAGRPRVLALLKMFYFPLHILLCMIFLKSFNIVGAALAIFAMRVAYSMFFSMSSVKAMGIGFAVFAKQLIPCYLITAGFLLIGFVGLYVDLWIRFFIVAVFSCIYLVTVSKWVLDPTEISFVVSFVKSTSGTVKVIALRLSKSFG
jgi:O-antigen/teichoic acid export membrane protein